MAVALTRSQLLSVLEVGGTAIFPNTLPTRAMRRAFDSEQRRLGHKAWPSPQILSWSEWVRSLWTALVTAGHESRLLLNPAQEASLWRELLADLTESSLHPADSLADLAQSAYDLAQTWEALSRLRQTASTHDTRTFAGWAAEFDHRCQAAGYVSAKGIEAAVTAHLRQGAAVTPSTLHLIGFDNPPPSASRLLATLRDRGLDLITCCLAPETDAVSGPLRLSATAATERDELSLAARWARSCLEDPAHPAANVGILLPDSVDFPEFESILREVLAPELQPVATDLSSTPWEFGAGHPLSSFPLIAHALDVLRLTVEPLSLDRLSTLLLSPYLGAITEIDAHARLDAYTLRRDARLRPELDLTTLRTQMSRHRPSATDPHAPASWVFVLADAVPSLLGKPKLRSFSAWSEAVRSLLHAAGWPGERPLTAREFEATETWDGILDLVATLDFAGERVPFSVALEAIDRQVRLAFLGRSAARAPVQILTLTQAEGMAFDAVLFLRATDRHWPALPRTHSLLGWSLQHDLAMPGTDASRDSAAIEHRILALLSTSRQALALHPLEDRDGPLRASPLFPRLGFTPIDAALLPASPAAVRITEEVLPDATPLPPLPSPEVRGGARVLQLQAACGFLAFAALRLGSTELEAREAGFDARETGTLLHRTLERFWARVRSQSELRALSPEHRNRLLTTCIDEAISTGLAVASAWDGAYLALQKERLRSLLSLWLDRELRRSPFRVLDTERDQLLSVGPLDLRVRMDRIDELVDGQGNGDGGVVLIDYKSGLSADPKSWAGDRPDEPQLPLYALLPAPEDVKALAFARVRTGKSMAWAGLQTESGILPTEGRAAGPVDLPGHIAVWREHLTALAEDFSRGDAGVHPKDFARNCTRCAQRLLCRLDPASLHTDIFPDPETDEALETTHG